MNLEKVFKLQEEYDEKMYESQNIDRNNLEHIFLKRINAILVEISELANEVQFFKYWKQNILIDKEKIIYELIDSICFMISLAQILQISKNTFFIIKIISNDLNEQFFEMYKSIIFLKEKFNIDNWLESFKILLGIATMLEIEEKDIIIFHEKKIKINFERIKNHY